MRTLTEAWVCLQALLVLSQKSFLNMVCIAKDCEDFAWVK